MDFRVPLDLEQKLDNMSKSLKIGKNVLIRLTIGYFLLNKDIELVKCNEFSNIAINEELIYGNNKEILLALLKEKYNNDFLNNTDRMKYLQNIFYSSFEYLYDEFHISSNKYDFYNYLFNLGTS